MNKVPKAKKQVATKYNVFWEFTMLGESDLAGIVLPDGEKEGQKLVMQREQNKKQSNKATRRHRSTKADTSKLNFIKDNLSRVSDNEDNVAQAPSSDKSNSSDDDESEDWSLHDNWMEQFGFEDITNSPMEQDPVQSTELPHGLHWDCTENIHATSAKKMKPTAMSVKPG
jgi:hypothetical protein